MLSLERRGPRSDLMQPSAPEGRLQERWRHTIHKGWREGHREWLPLAEGKAGWDIKPLWYSVINKISCCRVENESTVPKYQTRAAIFTSLSVIFKSLKKPINFININTRLNLKNN